MSSETSKSDYTPFVENHAHHDCVHRPESLFKRAGHVYGVDSAEELAAIVQAPKNCDWDTWYQCLLEVRRAYTSPEVIGLLVGDEIDDAAESGIDLYELRVSLLSTVDTYLKNKGLADPSPKKFWQIATQIWDEILKAVELGNQKHKMDTDLVMSISAQNKLKKHVSELMRLCSNTRKHIAGLDITHEHDNPPSVYKKPIDGIRQDIKGLTVHCMEVMGPERGWDVFDLNPDRVAHAVNLIKDRELMEEFAKRRIPIEICIHSNLVSGVTPELKDHHAPALDEAGIPLMIGSDGTNDGVTLADNYDLARELGFSEKKLAEFLQNGWDYAFRNLQS